MIEAMSHLLTIGIAALLPMCAMLAQEAQRSPIPYVRATGESEVTVKPDQATINIGVVTSAATAAAAASQNATQVTAVLDRIKKDIGDKGEIRTVGYSVNPNYVYPNPPNNNGPKISGYTASNTVRVILGDISLVGKVVDSATAAGANNINGIEFSVKDEAAVRGQALREAAVNAKRAGEAMASALGLKVVRVHSAETGEPSFVRPMQNVGMTRMAMAEARAPTPVELGNVQVRATVTVTLEITQ